MLVTYPPQWTPPNADRYRFRPADVATLEELMGAAKEVVRACGAYHGRQSAGWANRGQLNAGIAVTVMETGSFMDRLVKNRGKAPDSGRLILGGDENTDKSRGELT